jgi:hypothetical protein
MIDTCCPVSANISASLELFSGNIMLQSLLHASRVGSVAIHVLCLDTISEEYNNWQKKITAVAMDVSSSQICLNALHEVVSFSRNFGATGIRYPKQPSIFDEMSMIIADLGAFMSKHEFFLRW